MNTKSLTYSTIATIILITLLTISSELSKPFKEMLVGFTGHHWVTKGVFSLLFFLLIYSLSSKRSEKTEETVRGVYYVVATAVISGIAIFVFYIWLSL